MMFPITELLDIYGMVRGAKPHDIPNWLDDLAAIQKYVAAEIRAGRQPQALTTCDETLEEMLAKIEADHNSGNLTIPPALQALLFKAFEFFLSKVFGA